MKKTYYEFYPAENVGADEIKVFMDCGTSNIPNTCFCGCGFNRLFSDEEQQKNYNKKGHYRFFHNIRHIRRYKMLTKPSYIIEY